MTKQDWQVESLANLGRTAAGSAIVDAVWSTTAGGAIGVVLILNREGKWKAYTGVAPLGAAGTDAEAADALRVARDGAKVPFEVAFALFGSRGFGIDDYDGPCANATWARRLEAAR